MFNSSRLELSKSALESNLKFLKELIGPDVKFSSVVKGNAYGHGIEQFVPLAESFGVNHFSVFSAAEAYQLKMKSNGKSDVMIMGMMSKDALEWAILNDISFFVFEMERLNNALALAEKLNKKPRLHLELETGMNRTGFDKKDLDKVAGIIKDNSEKLIFEGICTHFAGAESISNYYRVQHQKKNFKKYYQAFYKKSQQEAVYRHSACSAACVRYPETRLDLVRIGIMQYGFWPSPETFIEYANKTGHKTSPLKRVISWKSEVMTVKKVNSGDYIGYGTSYLANTDMTVAVIPVGYSHGYSRILSNQGRVLIKGVYCQVVGIVNMNAVIADISVIENVNVGDEVVMIGKQGDAEISVASFSDFNNQINYELLTRLPEHLPRLVID